MDSVSEDRQELIRECTDFVAPDHGQGLYVKLLEDEVLTEHNLSTNKLRLLIKVQDIQTYRPSLHTRLLTDPESVIRALEIGVENAVRQHLPKTLQEGQSIKIGLTGELGPHTVSPRELSSAFISRLVRVEGIVTKCSLVRPKVIKSVHYCEETGQFQSKEYRDVSSTSGEPTGAVYPQKEDQGNILTTELGLCKYKDHQVSLLFAGTYKTQGQLVMSVAPLCLARALQHISVLGLMVQKQQLTHVMYITP